MDSKAIKIADGLWMSFADKPMREHELFYDGDFQEEELAAVMIEWAAKAFDFEPYQFVYFEAVDTETSNQIYCFYDDDTMQKMDVISALDEALIFCSNYVNTL